MSKKVEYHGGNIVAEGTPDMVKKVKESYTGQFLQNNQ